MNTARIALVALVSLTATAFAQERDASENGIVRVAALQLDANRLNAAAPVDPTVLDELAGRYEAADGGVFIVWHEAGSLVLELPAALAPSPVALIAASPSEYFAPEAGLRVLFEVDGKGHATGIVIRIERADQSFAAAKSIRHGVVTIEDVTGDRAKVGPASAS